MPGVRPCERHAGAGDQPERDDPEVARDKAGGDDTAVAKKPAASPARVDEDRLGLRLVSVIHGAGVYGVENGMKRMKRGERSIELNAGQIPEGFAKIASASGPPGALTRRGCWIPSRGGSCRLHHDARQASLDDIQADFVSLITL